LIEPAPVRTTSSSRFSLRRHTPPSCHVTSPLVWLQQPQNASAFSSSVFTRRSLRHTLVLEARHPLPSTLSSARVLGRRFSPSGRFFTKVPPVISLNRLTYALDGLLCTEFPPFLPSNPLLKAQCDSRQANVFSIPLPLAVQLLGHRC